MLDISENIGQNMHWKFIIGRLLYKTIEYALFHCCFIEIL